MWLGVKGWHLCKKNVKRSIKSVTKVITRSAQLASKNQINLVPFCFWVDQAVLGSSTEKSAILLKYLSFEGNKKLEFLYIVGFSMNMNIIVRKHIFFLSYSN